MRSLKEPIHLQMTFKKSKSKPVNQNVKKNLIRKKVRQLV